MKAPCHQAIRSSRGMRPVLLAAALVALAGCRGERSDNPPRQFFPDLDNQPKYKAQEESGFFEDGRSMREPVAGTVPFGAKSFAIAFEGRDFANRSWYLKDDRRIFEGVDPAPGPDGKNAYVERIPIPVDEALLALGEKKYNIYCIVCHSGTGDGKGTVGQRWSYPLPSFHDAQYKPGGEKGQDGYIFHTILNGVPNVGENAPYALKMPAYRSKLSEREAWAVVAYFRALQAAHASPLDVVPERERMELEKRRGQASSPPPAASPPKADASSSVSPLAHAGKERER